MEQALGRRGRALWQCPKCRHRFVTKNLSHSCVRVTVRAHFRGRAASLYAAYRAWAAVMVCAGHLDTHLWLRRRVNHPLLLRTEDFGRLGCAVHFRLERPEDIDDALSSLMHEAYELARTGPH